MKTVAWIVLVAILFVSTFGLSLCIVSFTAIVIFFIGGLTYIYIHSEKYAETYFDKINNYSYRIDYLKKVSKMMKKRKKNRKFDNRLTGSSVIDEELQTILYYVFRDFIYPWYDKISEDQEFPYQVKDTVCKIIVALANRIKEVDWIPYLTTQLVDDVASHLRLYKQARSKMKTSNNGSLETHFFDLEYTMEYNQVCRDHIALNTKEEKEYLQLVADALLYQLVPVSDFLCKPLRFLTREILAEVILLPLISMVSDPDYVNQTIIWLCSDFLVSSEIFLTILKTTNNVDELYAVRSSVQKEIASLRCRDACSDSDPSIKNQLSSLLYVDRIIDMRLSRLQEGSDRDSTGLPLSVDYSKLLSDRNLIQLPLDLILKNNIALSYFIDYMSSINAQLYIFAYLNMEGWKMSAQQELSKIEDCKNSSENINNSIKIYEHLKNAAQLLYDQYLSENVSSNLISDPILVRSLFVKIYTETPSENWFDDVIHFLYNTLQNADTFLPGFYKHPSYAKMLVELELLKEPTFRENEDEENNSADEFMISSSESSVGGSPVKIVNKDAVCFETTSNKYETSNQTTAFTLNAKIIETGLLQENGKTFGVYAVAVTKLFNDGKSESWHVYRRYSDFYELHQKLNEKYPDLTQIPFPGKKTFNNMERNLREKRMKILNNYMRILLQLNVIKSHPLLQDELLAFLESEYDKNEACGQFAKTFDNLVINPLKVVGNAVKTMPDNFLNTMDGMMEGFSRVFIKSFRNEAEEETTKVSKEIDIESHNIPLRIMLLLMTEVFDLKTRNQWLRRRIITLVRQIMHTMFGDIVNRRILDYVAVITSPSRVALFLANLKNSIWPNSMRAEPLPSRDEDIRMQTRVAAKCALLASFSDDLKHILGSETSRTGLMLLFSMFQHHVLNKRLLYVILEGFLVALFPNLNNLFQKLHAQSPRVIYNKKKKNNK